MSFVTDFIWRSPLGLRINAQATADVQMTEDWVRIRGDQLAPRNGEYDLRITAELWETHFFDLVSLLVVDHPEGTEMFVDERFAVPPPRLGAIATAPVQNFLQRARRSAAATSLDIVRARDDRHLDFAGRGAVPGRDARALRRARAARGGAAQRAAVAGRAGLGPSDRQLRSTSRSARAATRRRPGCRCTSPTPRDASSRRAPASGFPPARTRPC